MTTETATTAMLDLLHTDLLSLGSDAEPWARLEEADERWHALSSGEQGIVSLAQAIWRGSESRGSISILGALDKSTRLRALAVIAEYYGAMG